MTSMKNIVALSLVSAAILSIAANRANAQPHRVKPAPRSKDREGGDAMLGSGADIHRQRNCHTTGAE